MKVENTKCYLPIEIKARELDTRLYLAMSLVEKGFPVVLGKKSGVNRDMFSQNKNFIYFDKGISPGDINFYKAIKAANGYIVGIKEEGIFNNLKVNTQEFIENYNNSCGELFSLIFVWGKRTKEIIENHCPKLKNPNLIVTGHPSIDLLNENLISYYYKLQNLNDKNEKSYLLINTNFPKINGFLNFDQIKFFNYRNEKMFNKDLQKEYEIGKEFEKKIFTEFSKMIEALVKSFPEKNIVIRPHPVENIKIYHEKFKKFDNVEVIREGSSKEWIVGAESVIHHDCTTGIEAFFAKKHVISFSPYKNEKLIAKLPQDVSVKLNNINDLITFIKNGYILDSREQANVKKKKIFDFKDIIDNVDSNATNKIASSIENLCHDLNDTQSKIFIRKYYFAKYKLENLFYRIIMKLRGKNIADKDMIANQKSKFPYLRKTEIVNRMNILCEIHKIKHNYNINEIESDTFLIRK